MLLKQLLLFIIIFSNMILKWVNSSLATLLLMMLKKEANQTMTGRL